MSDERQCTCGHLQGRSDWEHFPECPLALVPRATRDACEHQYQEAVEREGKEIDRRLEVEAERDQTRSLLFELAESARVLVDPAAGPAAVEDRRLKAQLRELGGAEAECVIQVGTVTDEMVDRACTVLTDDDWFDGTFPESAMRRALEAALSGQHSEEDKS